MKLICPKCMNPVPVADDFGGREVTCPSCHATFEAPARYTPAVLPDPQAPPPPPPPIPEPPPMSSDVPSDRPLPPPGLVPSAAHPAPSSVSVPSLPGYTHARGITISPRVVAWLPAVLLTLTLFSTFFTWVGAYYVDHAVYSQSPWQALVGHVQPDKALVDRIPGAWLEQVPADWPLMIPFVFVLLVAIALAWADRFPAFDPDKIPPLVKVWPWRKAIIAGLAGFAFLLLFTEVTKGFGMERAIYRAVREDPAIQKAREEAGNNTAKLADVENMEERALARYNLKDTCWQTLGLWSNFLAVLAVVLSIVLDRRRDKPPPKLLLHY